MDEKNDIDNEEIEMEPPEEENKAKKLNISNIILVIIIAMFLIISIIVVFSKTHTKKKNENTELDKAGFKYIPDIELKEEPLDSGGNNDEQDIVGKKDKVDDIIQDLPEDFKQPEPGKAPISTSTGGSGSYKSDRPDTRNSISIRKIEGIAGREDINSSNNNKAILANALGRSSTNGGYGQQMSKEEYVANLLKQTQQASNGYNQNNQAAVSQMNKENFNNSKSNTANNGNFLSYASLWDGTIITGSLITGINTDNPGVVIARVTENVYSSYDSSFLLIPEGSLLYATYNSSVSYGQNRVQIAWNLLIRPDGYRMELGNMNGVDSQGRSGTKGFATNHPFETLKALGLVAVFSVIQTEISNDIKMQNNEYAQNALTDLYTETSKLGNKIVDKALDIKPTIQIPQGTQIKFITNTPLELPPVKVNQVNRKYIRNR